ncbi:MAG: FG-GAP repeat domain-containing protein, partial [Rudaea sp.]
VYSASPPLSFTRPGPGFAGSDRYFAVSAAYHGIVLPPSKEAYVVEFTPVASTYFGAMSVTDLNGDGCPDIFRGLGNCHGGFTTAGVGSLGFTPLYANLDLRDFRLADFNGDGIPDLVANVYSCDVLECGGPTANSQIMLFFGNADGTFTQDTAFTALNVPGGGYGETILVADFNNNGCLDIFLPKYTFYDPSEHNFLLINDCHGNFTDIAEAAGVGQDNENEYLRTEGAQALDINGDGWIDIYAGSQLFINNGDLTFTNVGITDDTHGLTSQSPWGLPEQFDEGAKFIDWDNSGQLSLLLNAIDGIRIFKYDGVAQFTEEDVIPPQIYMNESWGLTATDIDGDGRTDFVVAGGIDQSVETKPEYSALKAELAQAKEKGDLDMDELLDTSSTPNALPQLLVNRGQFVIHDFYDDGLTPATRGWNDLQTFADFDFGGTMDLASRFSPGDTTVLMNQATSSDIITVTVLGNNGEHNQQGRVVRVTPDARPNVTMTQVVDSGSGYMSNGPYDLTFATPYFGAYTVSVRFADATYTAVARRGDHLIMYANGTISHQ